MAFLRVLLTGESSDFINAAIEVGVIAEPPAEPCNSIEF
jgi:hypothetical protein